LQREIEKGKTEKCYGRGEKGCEKRSERSEENDERRLKMLLFQSYRK